MAEWLMRLTRNQMGIFPRRFESYSQRNKSVLCRYDFSEQGRQEEDIAWPLIMQILCEKSIIKTAKYNENKLALFDMLVMGREANMASFGQWNFVFSGYGTNFEI